jgi:hypothetical protein
MKIGSRAFSDQPTQKVRLPILIGSRASVRKSMELHQHKPKVRLPCSKTCDYLAQCDCQLKLAVALLFSFDGNNCDCQLVCLPGVVES